MQTNSTMVRCKFRKQQLYEQCCGGESFSFELDGYLHTLCDLTIRDISVLWFIVVGEYIIILYKLCTSLIFDY